MKRADLTIGSKVIGNGGYEGTVVTILDWSDSLVEVRYPGGIAVNDPSELKPVIKTRIKSKKMVDIPK